MDRLLLPALVVAADVALFAARTPPVWALVAYAATAVVVCVVTRRWPPAACGAALVLAPVTGSAFILLLWTSYRAGRATTSRPALVAVAGGTLASLAVRIVDVRTIPHLVATYAVFVVLPLLVGRYLAGQDEERLRLARDVHDSLGRRLSLVSVQAAVLEVTSTEDVSRLAAEVRGAVDDLHDLVGTLRGAAHPDRARPDIDAVVATFRAAGAPVAVRRRGRPAPLSTVAGQVAARVVEEGLTNAVRHAPGQPVTIELTWESDALLVSVTNPVPASDRAPTVPGTGLTDLRERCLTAGGMLDHRQPADGFRLVAMLPVGSRRRSPVALGVAVAVLMFVVLPASMLIGTR